MKLLTPKVREALEAARDTIERYHSPAYLWPEACGECNALQLIHDALAKDGRVMLRREALRDSPAAQPRDGSA